MKLGRSQTRDFALTQTKYFDISKTFSGSILDFGCGLGDAFPVYKKCYPKAKLLGLDISEEAIKKCKERYGKIANFICGTYLDVPRVDVIISSNVFEHLSNDVMIAKQLLAKCQQFYIIVPYKEEISGILNNEHINVYDEFYFLNISKNVTYKLIYSTGWGMNGFDLFYNIYVKNLVRLILGKKLQKRQRQIIYKIAKNPI